MLRRRVCAGCEVVVLAVAVVLGGLDGCAPDAPHGEAVALVRTHFPQHADRVLGTASGAPLVAVPDGGGFVPATPQGPDPVKSAEAALTRRGGLAGRFPAGGDGAVRFSLPDGFAAEVRETGLGGPGGCSAARWSTSATAGGGSFWSATEGGLRGVAARAGGRRRRRWRPGR